MKSHVDDLIDLTRFKVHLEDGPRAHAVEARHWSRIALDDAPTSGRMMGAGGLASSASRRPVPGGHPEVEHELALGRPRDPEPGGAGVLRGQRRRHSGDVHVSIGLRSRDAYASA
jgi:hypothetical protein